MAMKLKFINLFLTQMYLLTQEILEWNVPTEPVPQDKVWDRVTGRC